MEIAWIRTRGGGVERPGVIRAATGNRPYGRHRRTEAMPTLTGGLTRVLPELDLTATGTQSQSFAVGRETDAMNPIGFGW